MLLVALAVVVALALAVLLLVALVVAVAVLVLVLVALALALVATDGTTDTTLETTAIPTDRTDISTHTWRARSKELGKGAPPQPRPARRCPCRPCRW